MNELLRQIATIAELPEVNPTLVRDAQAIAARLRAENRRYAQERLDISETFERRVWSIVKHQWTPAEIIRARNATFTPKQRAITQAAKTIGATAPSG